MCVSCEHHRIVIFRKIVLYFSLSFLPTLLVEPVSKLASLPKWTSFRVRFSAVSYSVTQKTSTHFMSRERKWIEVCLGLKFLQLTPEEKNDNVLKCGCTSSTLRDLDTLEWGRRRLYPSAEEYDLNLISSDLFPVLALRLLDSVLGCQ